jgi:hypothetical protein
VACSKPLSARPISDHGPEPKKRDVRLLGRAERASVRRAIRARPTGYNLFVTDLMKAGLTKDQIATMRREVTGSLLMG